MNIWKLTKLLMFFASITSLAYPQGVVAVCPICTVTVGAGLGIFRFLEIDDTIFGVWIGGLILSASLWLASFLKRRNIVFPFLEFFSAILLFAITLLPMYWNKTIGQPLNTLWGADKIILGIFVGGSVFLLGVWADQFLRRLNNGKIFMYYQKVILPIFFLTMASFIFYLITHN